MTDTERLDALPRLLYQYDLAYCRHGYTFFPKLYTTIPPVVTNFYPTLRALIDAAIESQKETK